MTTTELAWFKSSCSGTAGDNCIEIAPTPATIHIRDSKDPSRPHLDLTPTAWTAFVAHAAAHAD